MKFADLRLAEPILRALVSEGYTTPTPIQAQLIPLALEGRDVLGSAQTGTGKTAAFALPILHRFLTTPRAAGSTSVRCLVLCPTRELASQTADGFRAYGRNQPLKIAVVYGGVGQGPQVQALRRGADVVVATPGRLLDLMNQRHVDLRHVEVLVLDEADRMLDMGFINDIRKIVACLPAKRQTLFLSATMPPEIRALADHLLNNAVAVQIATTTQTADNVEQTVYFVGRDDKPSLLAYLYEHLPMARTIVFTRTKRGADRVVKRLHTAGIRAEAIHGDKTQNARERALHSFKMNKTPILVATDIASRGIDVDGITHVVNYDLTHEPETYIHRIGRTARAGASGVAVSFCDAEEAPNLRAIEKLLKKSVPVKSEHPFVSIAAANAMAPRAGRRNSAGGQGSHSQGGHSSPSSRHESSRRESPRREPNRQDSPRQEYPRQESSRHEPSRHETGGRSTDARHEQGAHAERPAGGGFRAKQAAARAARSEGHRPFAPNREGAAARHDRPAHPAARHPLAASHSAPSQAGGKRPHAKSSQGHGGRPTHPTAANRPGAGARRQAVH